MANKRAPSEMQKYVIVQTDKSSVGVRTTYHYCWTQKEAKAWAKGKAGKKQLFRINYDYYGDL